MLIEHFKARGYEISWCLDAQEAPGGKRARDLFVPQMFRRLFENRRGHFFDFAGPSETIGESDQKRLISAICVLRWPRGRFHRKVSCPPLQR